jgi:hypothetical protein
MLSCETGYGQHLLAPIVAQWPSATATQRVILAGQYLALVGDGAIVRDSQIGWPDDMVRAIARMMQS